MSLRQRSKENRSGLVEVRWLSAETVRLRFQSNATRPWKPKIATVESNQGQNAIPSKRDVAFFEEGS
ncbi:MAG: hypothetical protein BWY17_03496 [Deltaproteobacteria bacterium ADurb.Bin207]|jgi:hypothetical protein|nr:MAG: hypothetical protein BWY17_03496 [Deltaproteobacteria bacterium ADurb.Bin207]